ncbi:hypothetical protein Dimus_031523 [Dionaea muscipula]
MLLSQLIPRPISSRSSRFWSSVTLSSLLATEKGPLNKVTGILNNSNLIEPDLDRIAHSVSPQVISSFIEKQHVSVVGFRFIFWAMKIRRLRMWKFYDLIIDLIVKREDGFELYWKTLEDLKDCGVSVPSDAFLVLISSYWKVGNPEKALDSFGKMRDFECEPDVYTYNAILYVLVQKEVFLLALTVYNQMLKLGCYPIRASYNILLDGLCKSGRMDDAVKLFDEMTQRGIKPNRTTYTIVLSGLCQAKRTHDALTLFNDMIKDGCHPDTITYNALLSGFCKFSRMDDAFVLLRSFESSGYSLGLNGYSCIIDGLFLAGRFEEAMEWFRKLCESLTPDVAVYTIMIRGFCKAGLLVDASELLQEMTEKGVVPDTQCYNSLIKGFCDMGLLNDAQSLKIQISTNGCFPDTCTYTILICGMCRNGLVREAEQIFEEMEKVGCSPTIVTLNALIDGLCKAGDLEGAHILFSKMELGTNPLVYLRLSQGRDRVFDKASFHEWIERLCESGLFLKAYKDLMQLADSGVVPDITTWNILIKGLCRRGDINGAWNLFWKLLQKGQPVADSITYGTLIDGLYQSDKVERALQVFDLMKKNGVSPTLAIYRLLMTWSCRKGKVSVAFSLWINYLRSLRNQDDEALKLAEEHFEKGEIAEAVKDLIELDFNLKEFDLAPYTIWLIGLCTAERVEEALNIFQILIENEVNVTAPSCVMLIRGLCRQRKMDLARDVFVYTLEAGLKLSPPICNQLLRSLLHSQDHRKQVFDLLGKMESVGYDLNAHLHEATKSCLLSYLNVAVSVMPIQETKPSPMAALGCSSSESPKSTKMRCNLKPIYSPIHMEPAIKLRF